METIKGYGTKPDGTKVDINSPDFKMQEYVSITVTEKLTVEQVKKLWNNGTIKNIKIK